MRHLHTADTKGPSKNYVTPGGRGGGGRGGGGMVNFVTFCYENLRGESSALMLRNNRIFLKISFPLIHVKGRYKYIF